MLFYTVKRIVFALPTLLIISVFIFALLRMVPGDPATYMIGEAASDAELKRLHKELGLDRSVVVQYLLWLQDSLSGNLGYSFMTGEAVLPALIERFKVTAQVVILAFVIAALIAIPAGMLAALRQHKRTDYFIVSITTLFISAPSFWIASLLALFFGAHLGWLPTLGFVPFSHNPAEWLAHILLPVTSLVFFETAILTRLTRASMIEVLKDDYITYARSKGLSQRLIIWRHCFKNAMSPTLTMLGLILGSLLSGTVVIESVFGLPGLGRFLIDAIYARDYPVIQGTVLFIVILYSVINLIVDLLYHFIDPRVSYQ